MAPGLAAGALALALLDRLGRDRGVIAVCLRPDTWLVLLIPPGVVWRRELLPMGPDLATWGP